MTVVLWNQRETIQARVQACSRTMVNVLTAKGERFGRWSGDRPLHTMLSGEEPPDV
jgi:hypothetical protein